MTAATRSVEDRLADLRHRREQIRAQESALLARAAAQARKDDTRRKILLGAFVLAKLDRHPDLRDLRDLLRRELPGFLHAARASEDARRRDTALLADLIEGDAPDGGDPPDARDGASTASATAPEVAPEPDGGDRRA